MIIMKKSSSSLPSLRSKMIRNLVSHMSLLTALTLSISGPTFNQINHSLVEGYPTPNIGASIPTAGGVSGSNAQNTRRNLDWENQNLEPIQHNNNQHDQYPEPKPKTLHHYHFNKQLNPYMQIHKLNSSQSNITCNDGSQIGYYMRLNNHSKSWIIYLQGGGFCGSEESCQQRWQCTPHLMSSDSWSKTKIGEGILSSDSKENPYLWNANHIYIPYCSSDSWTGQQTRQGEEDNQQRSSFSFMGSKIVERVLESLYEDLPKEYGLYEAKYILLAGDSAGATGVIMNLDKVNDFVLAKAHSANTTNCSISYRSLASSSSSNTNRFSSYRNCLPNSKQQPPIVRGLADSGWFLDNEPYDFSDEQNGASDFSVVPVEQSNINNESPLDCDKFRCTPLQSIRQAMQFWNGQVPKSCAKEYPDEPWRCYFGYRTYPTLKTPLFVVQWLYDMAQLMVDHIYSPPYTNGQESYVNKVVDEMRLSLENVTALFAPSCFSHSLITRQSWNQININGLKLPYILNSWEEQSHLTSTKNRYNHNHHNSNSARFRLIDSCKRPQCNRDCPDSDIDFNFCGGIQF